MLFQIAMFELRKRLTMISTYVYGVLFFACGVLAALAGGGAFSNVSVSAGSEHVFANAPYLVDRLITTISDLGVLMSAAVFGQAIHQDFESRTDSLIFTFPVQKRTYLGGRFLGGLVFVFAIFLTIGMGLFVGAHSPVLINKALFGPVPVRAYLLPYATSVLPNLIFTGSIFFALGALGRKMMPVYIGAVLVLVVYLVSGMLLRDLDNQKLAAYIDPFGNAALALTTRYWTTAEKNQLFVPLRGFYLVNRALWTCVGLGALALTYLRFTMGHVGTTEKKQRASGASAPISTGPIPLAPISRSNLRALLTLTRLGFAETVKNTYFAVLVLAAAGIALTAMAMSGKLFGTPTWPVTHSIASIGEGSFSLFLLIIITFYAGEIIWRERDLNLAQITDALPIPTWVIYLSKLISLCLVPALLLAVVILTGVTYQTAVGYHHYELGLYFQRLYLYSLPGYVFLCVLAFTVQSLVQNKYVGHALMVTYYVFTQFMDTLGLEHGLLKYGDTPSVEYSDMNGFGHFIRPAIAYDVYWSGVALILAVAGSLYWSRGTEAPFAARSRIARERFTAIPRAAAALGLLVALGGGAFIYYNEDILNHFRTAHRKQELQAEYEKKYKSLEGVPQPRITEVRADFDLFPERETLEAHGSYLLENKSGQPISTVYVQLDSEQKFHTLSVGEVAAPTESDELLGFYTYRLPTPLAPGAKIPLVYSIRFHDVGFKHGGNRTDLSANGTFFNSGALPHLGYDRNGEITLDNRRKKYGLAPRARLPDLNDAKGLANNLISNDADWVTFESTVSTSEDQTAIVPGYLQREWTEGGRRYFHYKMDAPILDFYSMLSARYATRKDHWNEVALEIYYQPGHEYDLDEMMNGMKDALSYYSKNFTPYQFRQARIIEFPNYATFAQSFPNTIPYSENIGFIARVNPAKADDVDYPYYVTAHEIAHQWWAHQLIGGNVQGVTLLDETLAQYSALMVMKAKFGAPKMRRFLKYELDQYLMGRSMEQQKEVPILRVENQQYIHYNKGSLVMYALQDYIGEERVDQALKSLLLQWQFKGPPYPNANALLDELKKVTPPDMHYLLHDLFETITLYDNRAQTAVAKKLPDGRYELTLEVSAKKMQAGEQGDEKEVPVDDYIDIGALDADGNAMAIQREKMKSGSAQFKLVVDKLPAKAGIDPLNMLIDRHPDDNVVAVTLP